MEVSGTRLGDNIKKYKNKIVIGLKIAVILLVFLSFGFMVWGSFANAVKLFTILFLSLLVGSVIYYPFFASENDRVKIVKIWSIYLLGISPLVVLLYSVQNKVDSMKLENLRAKYTYELATNNQNSKETFNKYIALIEDYLEHNKEKVVTLQNTETEETEHFYIWYGNFPVSLALMLTCFVMLYILTELEPFKRVTIKLDNKQE